MRSLQRQHAHGLHQAGPQCESSSFSRVVACGGFRSITWSSTTKKASYLMTCPRANFQAHVPALSSVSHLAIGVCHRGRFCAPLQPEPAWLTTCELAESRPAARLTPTRVHGTPCRGEAASRSSPCPHSDHLRPNLLLPASLLSTCGGQAVVSSNSFCDSGADARRGHK
jgi:hypothetical protein